VAQKLGLHQRQAQRAARRAQLKRGEVNGLPVEGEGVGGRAAVAGVGRPLPRRRVGRRGLLSPSLLIEPLASAEQAAHAR
jgi:hypothetical protein